MTAMPMELPAPGAPLIFDYIDPAYGTRVRVYHDAAYQAEDAISDLYSNNRYSDEEITEFQDAAYLEQIDLDSGKQVAVYVTVHDAHGREIDSCTGIVSGSAWHEVVKEIRLNCYQGVVSIPWADLIGKTNGVRDATYVGSDDLDW